MKRHDCFVTGIRASERKRNEMKQKAKTKSIWNGKNVYRHERWPSIKWLIDFIAFQWPIRSICMNHMNYKFSFFFFLLFIDSTEKRRLQRRLVLKRKSRVAHTDSFLSDMFLIALFWILRKCQLAKSSHFDTTKHGTWKCLIISEERRSRKKNTKQIPQEKNIRFGKWEKNERSSCNKRRKRKKKKTEIQRSLNHFASQKTRFDCKPALSCCLFRFIVE